VQLACVVGLPGKESLGVRAACCAVLLRCLQHDVLCTDVLCQIHWGWSKHVHFVLLGAVVRH
jgi:hypothetical protein